MTEFEKYSLQLQTQIMATLAQLTLMTSRAPWVPVEFAGAVLKSQQGMAELIEHVTAAVSAPSPAG